MVKTISANGACAWCWPIQVGSTTLIPSLFYEQRYFSVEIVPLFEIKSSIGCSMKGWVACNFIAQWSPATYQQRRKYKDRQALPDPAPYTRVYWEQCFSSRNLAAWVLLPCFLYPGIRRQVRMATCNSENDKITSLWAGEHLQESHQRRQWRACVYLSERSHTR